jgi:hypothetical protein
MEILAILVTGTLNIVCFLFGAKIGQTVVKGKDIETPTINPLKVVKEHQDKKQSEQEQKRIETIMRNIEAYDGTSNHQEDVPK